MFGAPGQGSEAHGSQRGGQIVFERFSTVHAAPRIETNASWQHRVDTRVKTSVSGRWEKTCDSLIDASLEQPLLSLRSGSLPDREWLRIDVTDHLFGIIESDIEALAFHLEFAELSDSHDPIGE